jgi:hypothetical protein
VKINEFAKEMIKISETKESIKTVEKKSGGTGRAIAYTVGGTALGNLVGRVLAIATRLKLGKGGNPKDIARVLNAYARGKHRFGVPAKRYKERLNHIKKNIKSGNLKSYPVGRATKSTRKVTDDLATSHSLRRALKEKARGRLVGATVGGGLTGYAAHRITKKD